jgi:hypothetical protein
MTLSARRAVLCQIVEGQCELCTGEDAGLGPGGPEE